ncbi:hypothetical protein COCNU_06G012140 [Cocos nucifera]|uniref:Uncharacterized protein n=1 Tax=Cocos nucifera TaxID=13894 RepID=A0A8K0ICD3_COCNU|nr:hypothetical protein COCNU_06G012140 [Cocos nucifera]
MKPHPFLGRLGEGGMAEMRDIDGGRKGAGGCVGGKRGERRDSGSARSDGTSRGIGGCD